MDAPARHAAVDGNPLLLWWRDRVTRSVHHHEVVDRVHEEARCSAHYIFMTVMSAGIAVLGLLLSSPAVVIGAMLISPLMGPILGLGFGIALFDLAEVRRSLYSLAVGILLAVMFCALIVLMSPLQTVTSEIAARTRPNLFDLFVAVFSGLAGTYAMIRGRHGAIVGVAIAVAVMPPLATIGFGLATSNWTVAGGAALLFFTNLMAIAVAAAVLARLYGFGHQLSPKQTWAQAALVLGVFVALAVPLGLSLRQIAWEAVAARQAHEIVEAQFADGARVDQIDIDYREPLRVTAAVFTPDYRPGAEAEAEQALQVAFGRPVLVEIEQLRVGTADAEASQLASARVGQTPDRSATRLAERLALVAGVPPGNVLVDRAATRARVEAAVLPGADLATYRALEARVRAAEPRWDVQLVPPPAALPEIPAGEDAAALRQEALATAVWGARRLRQQLAVAGPAEEADEIVAALQQAGVAAERIPGGTQIELRYGGPGPIQ